MPQWLALGLYDAVRFWAACVVLLMLWAIWGLRGMKKGMQYDFRRIVRGGERHTPDVFITICRSPPVVFRQRPRRYYGVAQLTRLPIGKFVGGPASVDRFLGGLCGGSCFRR